MTISTVLPQLDRALRFAHGRFAHRRLAHTRLALVILGVAGMLLSLPRTATSQAPSSQPRRWEIRGVTGVLVPTGAQRDALKSAQVTGAQVAWLARPSLAITGSFGWAPSRDLGSTTTPKLDVFTSDVGAEFRPATWFAGRTVTFSPIVGAGAGARSYNYRSLKEDAAHNLSGYAALGGELGFSRVGLRLEVRDYVSAFKPLVGGGQADSRNDVMFMAALRFTRKRAAAR